MNRGTVMSLNKRTAVVLTPDGQFVRVKRKAHFEVGEEIYDNIAVRSFPRVRQRLVQAGAFASVILLVLFGFLIFRTPPVVAYVSMDINPSIELGLDANERVRELRAMNEDAQAIVAGLKYRGQNLETVMNELARKLVDRHILTLDDGEIVIASVPVRPVQEHWETRVALKMKQILSDATKRGNPDQQVALDVTTVFLPVEVRNEAEANGVSSGKMAFWLISKSQGHEITLETLKSQSLKNIAASWGGVNKVMSKYEQKKVNNNKENADSNNNKGTPTPNNNMDDKGNKDGKSNNQVDSNKQNVDNKKDVNKTNDNKKVLNKKNDNKNNNNTINDNTKNDGTKNDNKKNDVGNTQIDKNIDGNHNNPKNDVTRENNATQKNDNNIDNNIDQTKIKVKNEDLKKSWELLLDEAKQNRNSKQGNSSESDHSNGSVGSDENKGSKSSDKSGHSDNKNN
jgi:hypothetical protein